MPNPANTAQITYTDNHLNNLHQNVAVNLKQAGVNTPYQAVKPIHVPDAQPRTITEQGKIDDEKSVPGSFNTTHETALSPLKALSEHLDYADQIVTGRSHVVDEASRFTAHRDEKEQKKLEYANAPKAESKSPVKKFVDWLHK